LSGQLRFYDELWVGKGIDDAEELVSVICDGNAPLGVYAVCVSPLSNGLFVIISVKELLKPYNMALDYTVVGLAKGKRGAKLMVADIIESWLIDHTDLEGIKAYYS
jgi:hypothetical protein